MTARRNVLANAFDDPPAILVLTLMYLFGFNLLLLLMSLCFGGLMLGFSMRGFALVLPVSWLIGSVSAIGLTGEIHGSRYRRKLIRRFFGVAALLFNGVVAVSALALVPSQWSRPISGDAIVLVCVGGGAILSIMALMLINRMKPERPGICPKCNYDLRGADHHACPECGNPVARNAWRTRKSDMSADDRLRT